MKKIDWAYCSNRVEIEEAYKTLAKNCNIRVGDTVRVIRNFEDSELGCVVTGWNRYLEDYIGTQYTVIVINKDGSFNLRSNLDSYIFIWVPFFILEKVKDASPIIQILVNGREIPLSEETIENIRKEI